MTDTIQDLPVGTVVDRYRIEGPLGEGGFGAVYRARHTLLGHAVALKVLHPEHARNPEVLERFFREARAAASVGSPHIVKVSDCGTSPTGQPFLVMELLEGQALEELVACAGPLPLDRGLAIGLQILEGLAAAHGAGIVHRDLKPGNVFVARNPRDGSDHVKLLDFGISKFGAGSGGPALTRTGAVLGTPLYMAPEQFRGARDVDHRVDLYAAAAVLFELFSGRVPHEGQSYAELAVNVVSNPARPLGEVAPWVPQQLAEAVDRGLALSPDDRYGSAREFSGALRVAGATLPPAARQPGSPSPCTEPGWPEAAPQGGLVRQSPSPLVSQGVDARVGSALVSAGPRAPLAAAEAARRRRRTPAWVLALAAVFTLLVLGGGALGLVLALRPSRPVARPEPVGGAVPSAAPPAPAAPSLPQDLASPFGDLVQTIVGAAGEAVGIAPTGGSAPAPVLVVHEPHVAGALDPAAVRQVLETARPAMERCRPIGQGALVRAQIRVLPGGRVSMAAPAPGNLGPADLARCCAECFREAVPEGWAPGPNGVVFFDVSLPPR